MRPSLLAAVLLAACARSKTPDTTAEAPPAPAPPPAATAPAPEPTPAPTAGPTLFAHMVGHVAWATVARDALVHGDVARARGELSEIAAHDLHPDLSQAQQAMTLVLQQAAGKVDEARSTIDVARVLADTAVQCGVCHTGHDVVVRFDTPPDTARREVPHHMHRHLDALDRLWEGLVGPSEASWRAGAKGLEEDALTSSQVPHGEDRDHAVDVMARYVHERGREALEVTTADARAETFAGLIATCADCHAETLGR